MSITGNQVDTRMRQIDNDVGVVGPRAVVAVVRPLLARQKIKPILEVVYSETLNQNVMHRAIAHRLLEQYSLPSVQSEILFWSLIGKSREEFHEKHRTAFYGKRAISDTYMMTVVLKMRSVFKFETMIAEVAIMVAAGRRNPMIAMF